VLGPRGASCTKAPRGPSATPLGLASTEGLGLICHRSISTPPLKPKRHRFGGTPVCGRKVFSDKPREHLEDFILAAAFSQEVRKLLDAQFIPWERVSDDRLQVQVSGRPKVSQERPCKLLGHRSSWRRLAASEHLNKPMAQFFRVNPAKSADQELKFLRVPIAETSGSLANEVGNGVALHEA
jgi:hypothetical protein